MDESGIRELLERIGCRKIKKTGKEFTASCPFFENHYRGDRSPSFSTRIDPEGKSPYFCFSCHEKGTIEYLAVRTGNEDLVPDWKAKKIDNKDWMIHIPKTNAGVFNRWLHKKREPVFFDTYLISPYVGRVSRYILDRGINIETAKAWELGVDRVNKRAIFVLRDVDHRVAMVMGRDVTDRSKIKYTNYVLDTENDCLEPFIDHEREECFIGPTKSFFLYGEYLARKVFDGEMERRSKDLIVVEGQMDTLSVWQNGWNVVGILGSYPNEDQIEKLVALLPRDARLVSVMDGDKAGRNCTKELGKMLEGRVPFYYVELPEGEDPADIEEKRFELLVEKANIFNLTAD